MSLSKPHLRPIVRGKEVKSVEFGAKVNNILVDGISFIEKLSFNAFNEGTRLVHCLKMHKKLFGVEAKKVGGDTGYAGTENRDYCKANGIQTSFVKRGRPFGEKKKEKDLVRKELARVRATAMEGSFGTQKEHYEEGQGQDEAVGNPLHLLRHPHGKRGATSGQDITKGAFGGCLTLKLAVNAVLLQGNCILSMKNRQKKSGRNDRKQI